jgi:hypothetical protein
MFPYLSYEGVPSSPSMIRKKRNTIPSMMMGKSVSSNPERKLFRRCCVIIPTYCMTERKSVSELYLGSFVVFLALFLRHLEHGTSLEVEHAGYEISGEGLDGVVVFAGS